MRILIADDHALVRQGLTTILNELDGATFVEAENASQVLELVKGEEEVSIILLDLFMPGDQPFELIRRTCNSRPDTPVVVISGSDDPAHMRKALDCGASGFISKSAAREVLISAIRLVMAGGIYIPPELLQRTRPEETVQPSAGSIASRTKDSAVRKPLDLTARQQQVLRLIIAGDSNKEIAAKLGVSGNTVKIHVASILKMLGVNNRTKAALVAKESGFRPEPENENP